MEIPGGHKHSVRSSPLTELLGSYGPTWDEKNHLGSWQGGKMGGLGRVRALCLDRSLSLAQSWSALAAGLSHRGCEHLAHKPIVLKLLDYFVQKKRHRRRVWAGHGEGREGATGKGSEAPLPEWPIWGRILTMTPQWGKQPVTLYIPIGEESTVCFRDCSLRLLKGEVPHLGCKF